MKLFLSLICFFVCYNVSGQNSENSYWVTNKGTLRVLVVYAELVNDPNYDNVRSNDWLPGEMPVNPDYYFSAYPDEDDGLMTRFFHEASSGAFNIIGACYPKLVQVDYNKAGYQSVRQVINTINEDKRKKIKSTHGYKIGSKAFDAWTFKGYGTPRLNEPDSILDVMLIVWRVNSRLSTATNSGYCSTGAIMGGVRGYKGVSCYSEFVSHDNNAFLIMKHEFSHTLYGGNNFHTAGPGAGNRTFIPAIGGYSNLSSWDHMSDSWNGWDRWRMGWKRQDKKFLISSFLISHKNYIEKDFESYEYNKDSLTVYVRDFRNTGDAVRIRLPGIDSPSLKQYLWLEFHSDTSLLDINRLGRCGLYAYIQVGKDDKKNLYGDSNTSPGNYLYFLPASGRYDFEYGVDSIKNKVYMKQVDSLSNPLTGNNVLMRPVADINHNEKLEGIEMLVPEMFITGSLDTIITYPTFGSASDAFRPQGNKELSNFSNPASVNVTTYNYPYHTKNGIDIDSIYLNGLNISIIDSVYISVSGKKYIALGLKVKWNDYNVNRNVRWCGNIVFRPLQGKTILDVTGNSTLLLDRGLSVTLPSINRRDTLKGKFYFSSPTSFICYDNTVLHIHKGSTLKLINGSTLIMKKGSELLIDEGVNIETDPTSAIIKE